MKLFLKRWVVTPRELATWNSEAHRVFFCFGKSRIQWVAGMLLSRCMLLLRLQPRLRRLGKTAVSLYAFITKLALCS